MKGEDSTDRRPWVVALVGPTASGKTRLGVAMAKALGTSIISVDSMAVYRGMDIGTAKPTMEEREGVEHHLLDVVDPDEHFSAADFASRAAAVLDELHSRGKIGLVVGGTGLYLRALLSGLARVPPPAPALRGDLEAEFAAAIEQGDPGRLHRRLARLDPPMAERLHPNDRVRIIRALEVVLSSGQRLSAIQDAHRFRTKPYRTLILALDIDRATLFERIDRRVEVMLDKGLEAEVASLLERYGPDIRPMKGLGYLHCTRILGGEVSRKEGIALFKRDTRRFARRQLTWFRGEAGVRWVKPEIEILLEQTLKCVETRPDLG